ncbi:hypothetical protein T492DRAFT_892642 [Pavlovales sp. CCMP2436]|nr:hypothetical protein T492DRAFT_892642 [Pavlovales sp. CCMP2436]
MAMDATAQGLAARLEATARAKPLAIAIADGGCAVSFGDLQATHGVAPGAIVTLALPRSTASIAWLFAIWQVGGVCYG